MQPPGSNKLSPLPFMNEPRVCRHGKSNNVLRIQGCVKVKESVQKSSCGWCIPIHHTCYAKLLTKRHHSHYVLSLFLQTTNPDYQGVYYHRSEVLSDAVQDIKNWRVVSPLADLLFKNPYTNSLSILLHTQYKAIAQNNCSSNGRTQNKRINFQQCTFTPSNK